MKKVYVVGAKRSAIGSFMGTLNGVHPSDFGSQVLKQLLDESKVPVDAIDEVQIGNILPAGLGQGLARQISIKSGIPVSVPAYGVNMVCGSGMKTSDLLTENTIWNNDESDDPEVLVQGVGRYRLSQLKDNVRRKIADIAKTAESGDDPDVWRKLAFMLNHAAMREMVKTIDAANKEQRGDNYGH